jgi:nucleoid DNA-binding protein
MPRPTRLLRELEDIPFLCPACGSLRAASPAVLDARDWLAVSLEGRDDDTDDGLDDVMDGPGDGLDELLALDEEEPLTDCECARCGELVELNLGEILARRAALPDDERRWLEGYIATKRQLRRALVERQAVETELGLLFSVHSPALPGRNPQTGGMLEISARTTLHFLPGARLLHDACPAGLSHDQVLGLLTGSDKAVWGTEDDDLVDLGTFLEIPPPGLTLSFAEIYPTVVEDLRARRLSPWRGLGYFRLQHVSHEDAEGDLLYLEFDRELREAVWGR